MKYLIVIASLICLTCSGQKESVEGDIVASDSAESSTEDAMVTEASIEEDTAKESEVQDDDCVFNNDFKGLTTEWLAELGRTKYIWREDLAQALIPMGQDTIYVSKGGCNHFGISVELHLNNDNHTLADSVFWVENALKLAQDFKMEEYQRSIEQKKIKRLGDESDIALWFEIIDAEDNYIYEGIIVKIEKNSKIVSISQYLN